MSYAEATKNGKRRSTAILSLLVIINFLVVWAVLAWRL